MAGGCQRDQQELRAVVDPPGVLPPGHLLGVGVEAWSGDVVAHADLGAPDP